MNYSQSDLEILWEFLMMKLKCYIINRQNCLLLKTKLKTLQIALTNLQKITLNLKKKDRKK